MENEFYLDIFKKAADQLDKAWFIQNQLELKVGTWRNSVVLKIQKASWCNNAGEGATFKDGIFFSIWINDELINQHKLFYNIHALKLRELKGYKIKSRDFADDFRAKFRPFEKDWPNVSTRFGPQTLMEGWVTLDLSNFEIDIKDFASQFLTIQSIIDDLLAKRKK